MSATKTSRKSSPKENASVVALRNHCADSIRKLFTTSIVKAVEGLDKATIKAIRKVVSTDDVAKLIKEYQENIEKEKKAVSAEKRIAQLKKRAIDPTSDKTASDAPKGVMPPKAKFFRSHDVEATRMYLKNHTPEELNALSAKEMAEMLIKNKTIAYNKYAKSSKGKRAIEAYNEEYAAYRKAIGSDKNTVQVGSPDESMRGICYTLLAIASNEKAADEGVCFFPGRNGGSRVGEFPKKPTVPISKYRGCIGATADDFEDTLVLFNPVDFTQHVEFAIAFLKMKKNKVFIEGDFTLEEFTAAAEKANVLFSPDYKDDVVVENDDDDDDDDSDSDDSSSESGDDTDTSVASAKNKAKNAAYVELESESEEEEEEEEAANAPPAPTPAPKPVVVKRQKPLTTPPVSPAAAATAVKVAKVPKAHRKSKSPKVTEAVEDEE